MDMTLSLPRRFERAYPPTLPAAGAARWLVFRGEELVVSECGTTVELLTGDALGCGLGAEVREIVHLGRLDGVSCLAGSVPGDAHLDEGLRTMDLRTLFEHLPADLYAVAGYAYQLVRWQRASRFCAFCGAATGPVEGEWGRRCGGCNHVTYPHVSPCVIVLIHDGGDRLLLAHRRGRGAMRSLIAGFLEPSESLEEALRREVREEVGLEIDDIRYFASQPWPFPHQLMVGFFARHAGGEVRPDGDELDEARWYDVDDLPTLPGPISIARRLIDAFVTDRIALRSAGRND
ncbi:MAG: NAD(+) diphosphatase [bacterium]